MTAQNCTDQKLGALLHAYELKALSESDTEKFEVHLMGCDYCFREVERFASNSDLLRDDPAVQQEIAATVRERTSDSTVLSRMKRYLWPDVPLIFRPAVALVIAMLLLYPAWRGIRSGGNDEPRTVQSISLFASRSAGEETYHLLPDQDVLLSFVYPDFQPGHTCSVQLADERGNELYSVDSFRDFDEYGTGRLLIPNRRFHSGLYELTIADVGANSGAGTMTFSFRVEK